MKKVEKEALLKGFFLFFLSQTLLVGALFLLNYQKEMQTLNESIFSKMRLCSFSLQCDAFKLDFTPVKEHELYKLYKDKNGLSAYFSIPNSTKNSLKVSFSKHKYEQKLTVLKQKLLFDFCIVLLIIAVLSLVFALYALYPLKKALHVTEEFIKDILHDFNTPLSTLRLNVSMLKSEFGENSKINRIENAVQNILNLQANLRSYLHSHAGQKEQFNLSEFLNERVDLLRSNYKGITFIIGDMDVKIYTNRAAFTRIIDNLLSNAAKYNKQDGKIEMSYNHGKLSIADNGKGIQNPKKVFERFYKEQARGIGIGLHIVKKLCEELDIDISLKSEVNKGTTFFLTLQSLTIH